MRVVVSTPTFLPIVGGAELAIHEVYRRLGRSHDVTILTPHLPDELLANYSAQDYSSDNYKVRYIYPGLDRVLPRPARRALKRTSLLYAADLVRIARHERPDILDFHFIKPHGAALVLMQRLYGIPGVLTLAGRSDVMRLLSAPKRAYAKAVISRADLVVPNSTYYLGAQAPSPRIRIIASGVDTREFSPARRSSSLRRALGIADGQILLLSIQRLAPVKRIDLIIRAMSIVVKRNPKVVLLIGGKGEEEHRLRRLVADLGLAENVRFAGYIASERLADYFASADAFVFHSMVETFGTVFIQAMASELPIVAADTSCVSDVLTPDNGLLFRPSDMKAFADAILRLADDQALRKQIGEHNRMQAVREFDWDLIATQYEQALQDTLDHRKG